MAYRLVIDEVARVQISALPAPALTALAEAFEVITLVPERGTPHNHANPTGGLYQLVFGGQGLIIYLLLADQDRVDILQVTWIDA